MNFTEPRKLGRTGLEVGALGVASGYGAPTEAFEEAFERGCNYFYWGSRRTSAMRQAIQNLCNKGKRDALVILIQSYARSSVLMDRFLRRGLGELKLDYVDILLLGWHNKTPSEKILDRARELKAKGLVRFLALSTHSRPLIPQLAASELFDVFHIRYNAAHRGAEKDIFPHLPERNAPGMVAYTATRWGQLLKPAKMPAGEPPLLSSDCYRFALSNPAVDVCMCGPKDAPQMKEALRTLDLGPLSETELKRVQKIGDHVRANARWLW